jgi:serine protease AprX
MKAILLYLCVFVTSWRRFSAGLLATFLLSATTLFSQEQTHKYWIYFCDKAPAERSFMAKSMSTKQLAIAVGLSERALARRAKVMPEGALITFEDLPVAPEYLLTLTSQGIHIENVSRWFNAATARLTAEQYARVAGLSCVRNLKPVRTFVRRDPPASSLPPLEKTLSSTADLHDYGNSYTQLNQIRVPDVHNLRITGRGVLVGMLDSGFRWRVNEATKNMAVIKEYDFIQQDTITANEPDKVTAWPDASNQDGHGTTTLSVVGGFKEGQLVSPAFGSQFILAKTEYIASETTIEEDFWAAGIEWEEQNGVDVVSSSLGYSDFDPGQKSYTYADMNGRSATTSKAAVLAARRGVVVVSSMGNEGASSWRYLTAPADADSIISVGAVSSAGNYAYFSSIGPTSDGRMKPDVVAQGVTTWGATTSPTGYGYSQGTSLSTPLVAGAAALVLSAHPELTPIQVRDALRNTASNTATPNDSIGWGIIDVYKAMLYNGMVLSTDPEITTLIDSQRAVSVFVVSGSMVKKDSVQFHYTLKSTAGPFTVVPMTLTSIVDSVTNSGKYTVVVPNSLAVPSTHFYVSAVDATNKVRTAPYNAPENLYIFNASIDIYTGERSVPVQFVLRQNYPNPFNPSTTIEYALQRAGLVRLELFNALGQQITTLVEGSETAGTHSVIWNGSRLPSGVYFYRLTAGESVAVRAMILIK